jgi:hypothetical protein
MCRGSEPAGRPTSATRGPDALGGTVGTTEAREAALRGSGISEAAAKVSAAATRALMQSPLAPPAGGPGSLLMDRGRKVVGISGEVYRTSGDPKLSTAAQRTWLPAHDPGVKAMLHVSGVGIQTERCRLLRACFRTCLVRILMQPPAPKLTDTSFMSLPIHGHANQTVQRASAGSPHGRHASYAAAPVVLTDVTIKHGAAARVFGGSTQVWADERH